MNGMLGREGSAIYDAHFLYTLQLGDSVARLDCGLTCHYGDFGVFGSASYIYTYGEMECAFDV
jgi:hypothetical protein